jgi:hypothetical protein
MILTSGHPLAEQYTLTCQHCQKNRLVLQVGSAGFVLGMILESSPSDPDYGLCLWCRRYKMMVTKVPDAPEPNPPKGFTRIPIQ